jgi:hypothetical protein
MTDDKDPRLEEVETSTLPLSDREENPPLVVDLPDGQKLVVGDIKAGTVIEVATWRGTGRPDSRTHRFMLGISHDEPEVTVPREKPKVITVPEQKIVEAQEPVSVGAEVVQPRIEEEVTKAPEPFVAELPIPEVFEPVNFEVPEVPEVFKVADEGQPVVEEKKFIQSESLTSRIDLLFGASARFVDTDVPNSTVKKSNKELVAPMKKTKPKRKFKVSMSAVYSVVAVAALASILSISNVTIAHPKSGLETAMGDAKSTVMILRSKDEYVVGESIVGDSTSPEGKNPVFGVVAAVGDGVYMLNGNIGFVSVNHDQVRGKVLAIAPWWGKLISAFDK